MDMDQLACFRCLAETKNFTKAAQRMHVSQPALSRSIQRLEEELGQPLFKRKPRSVELTDAGALFLSRVGQILAILEDTKAEICDDGQSGRLRIGAIPTIAPYFLPDFLREFATDHPKATVQVQEATTDELLKRCKHGELDVAILALPIPTRHVEVESLFTEELLVVLPNDHPLVDKEPLQLADLEEYPFILLDEAHCLSDNITSFCHHRQVQPVTVEKTNQLVMVQELVTLGHGISMIPQMARKLDPSKRRVYRNLSGTKPFRTIAAVWNPYRFHSRLMQQFQNALRQYVGNHYGPKN